MASSGKSSRSNARFPDLAGRIHARLSAIVPPGARLLVGLSGGVDSIVLLDCLQRVGPRLRASLAALYVNHQLSPDAKSWERFCRRQCRARKIPFASARVVVPRGESVEAAARAARYAVFSRQRADFIVLAQHQDDQVETLLLQLLRGAGVRGLAAMPLLRRAEGGGLRAEGKKKRRGKRNTSSLIPHPSSLQIVRPMLDITRAEILAYARARRLEWIEDESNANVDIRRNFLRHRVLPVVAREFPAYRSTVARAARHLAEASELLDELAAQDGAGFIGDGTLAVDALRRLSNPRARNLLRFFLASRGAVLPGAERLDEALRQALTARQDAKVVVELDAATLRRYKGRLHVVPAFHPLARNYAWPWRGEREMELELGGVLSFKRARGKGISVARLRHFPVTVRLRLGGESLQPDCRRPRRSLKNLLQEGEVAPWLRDRLPLVFCGRDLVWAPGIGVDCAFQAGRGEPALSPVWHPSAATRPRSNPPR
jgi:tRNA(Ile)-lysidine synthase